jgi:hypothetical protein
MLEERQLTRMGKRQSGRENVKDPSYVCMSHVVMAHRRLERVIVLDGAAVFKPTRC